MSESGGDKEFDATENKIKLERDKGNIPLGRDILTAASYCGVIFVAFLSPESLWLMGDYMIYFLRDPSAFIYDLFNGQSVLFVSFLSGFFLIISPWFIVPAIFVVASVWVQKGWIFSWERFRFKLDKISVLSGFKKKFGVSGIFDFIKGLLKGFIFISIFIAFVFVEQDSLLFSSRMSFDAGLVFSFSQVLRLLVFFLLCQFVFGFLDAVWQIVHHRHSLKMTRQEMRDEIRQLDGDPNQKAMRRQKAMDLAANQMISDVKKADVIIVNPTHYAVALMWRGGKDYAPICVAKGVDELAHVIRRKAQESHIPIYRDAPTARELYAQIEVGGIVQPSHYLAVAVAIRFALSVKRARWDRMG